MTTVSLLAQFAQTHGHQFGRVERVIYESAKDEVRKRIDLTNEKLQKAGRPIGDDAAAPESLRGNVTAGLDALPGRTRCVPGRLLLLGRDVLGDDGPDDLDDRDVGDRLDLLDLLDRKRRTRMSDTTEEANKLDYRIQTDRMHRTVHEKEMNGAEQRRVPLRRFRPTVNSTRSYPAIRNTPTRRPTRA